MYSKAIILTLFLSLGILSCTEHSGILEESGEHLSLDDHELIAAIDNDNQLRIGTDADLPLEAITLISDEYPSGYIQSVRISNKYGAKVELGQVAVMDDAGTDIIYFNKEGKKLKSDPRNSTESSSSTCIEIQFPITYILPDGSKASGDSREGLAVEVGNWFRKNPSESQRPTLQFPVTVLKGDLLIEVQSEDELSRIASDCNTTSSDVGAEEIESVSEIDDSNLPGTGASCFKLIYPVTITMPDGKSYSAKSEEDLVTASESWRADSPESKELPRINYPVQIALGDAILTLSSDADMSRAESACDSDDGQPQDGSEEGGESESPDVDDRDGNG